MALLDAEKYDDAVDNLQKLREMYTRQNGVADRVDEVINGLQGLESDINTSIANNEGIFDQGDIDDINSVKSDLKNSLQAKANSITVS